MTSWPATSLIHPSAIVRGQWAEEPAQVKHIERFKDNDYIDPAQVESACAGWALFPGVEDVTRLVHECRSMGAASIDIESAGNYIICVGVVPFSLDTWELGRGVCIRFRMRNGVRYWNDHSQLKVVVQAFSALLEDSTAAKVFHNGVSFDLPLLIRHGFVINGRIIDTMLMMRSLYSEMKASLQYCATLLLGAPVWKSLLDDDDVEK